MLIVIKMKKDISLKIKIPEGIEISLDGEVAVKSNGKELSEKFNLGKLELRKEGSILFIEANKGTKREKKMAGTVAGKIRNMIKGVGEGFTYKLQVAGSHFPMRIEIDNSKRIFSVKNFLGERIPRKAKILPDVDVKLEGEIIIVHSAKKEAAGQTASNIEATTKVKKKDRRIFQDGIYLTEKPKLKN